MANYLSRGVSDIGNTAPGLCGHYLLVLCQSIVHHASIHERINPSNLLHTMDVCSDTLEPRLHPNFIHLTFICKLKCKMLNGLAGQEKLYDAITPGVSVAGPVSHDIVRVVSGRLSTSCVGTRSDNIGD